MINENDPVDIVPYGDTVIPDNRLKYLASKCKETLVRVPGNVLEVGVYRGGTLIKLAEVLREVCPEYKVHGIDTFTGHPYSDNHPVHPKGKYADVTMQELEGGLVRRGLEKYVELHTGRIEDIWKELDIPDISFAHIDCDLYTPVRFCAEHVQSQILSGGVIYFDDYGHAHCPGATRAVQEAFDQKKLHRIDLEDGTSWSCYVEL